MAEATKLAEGELSPAVLEELKSAHWYRVRRRQVLASDIDHHEEKVRKLKKEWTINESEVEEFAQILDTLDPGWDQPPS